MNNWVRQSILLAGEWKRRAVCCSMSCLMDWLQTLTCILFREAVDKREWVKWSYVDVHCRWRHGTALQAAAAWCVCRVKCPTGTLPCNVKVLFLTSLHSTPCSSSRDQYRTVPVVQSQRNVESVAALNPSTEHYVLALLPTKCYLHSLVGHWPKVNYEMRDECY